MKFIKYYSLEIFTVIAMIMMCAAVFIDTNIVQKMSIVFLLIFVLHEWEEQHYPGGFLDHIMDLTGMHVSKEIQRGSRVPTSIYLGVLTMVPFFVSQYPLLIIPAGFLGIWEGIVHLVGIKLFNVDKPYTPGLVTALLEVVIAAVVFWYLISRNMVSGWDFLIGFVIMLVGFMLMQRSLVHMTGNRYRDLPKMAKANLAKRKA